MDFQITNSSQVLDFCLKRLARYAENNCLDVCRDYNNKWGEFHPQQIIF